jgi:pro-sigmaK processing inhibitor BofA
MEIMKYFIIGVISITVLMILIFALKSRKFFKTLFINALLGLGAIAIIDITSKYTGVHIPINYWTASAGGILGLPGVFGVLISNFIFI